MHDFERHFLAGQFCKCEFLFTFSKLINHEYPMIHLLRKKASRSVWEFHVSHKKYYNT
jgi:hypothetical protein